MSEPENIMRVSEQFWRQFWKTFADIGPRHRNVARWESVLGWHIDLTARAEYLAPERPSFR